MRTRPVFLNEGLVLKSYNHKELSMTREPLVAFRVGSSPAHVGSLPGRRWEGVATTCEWSRVAHRKFSPVFHHHKSDRRNINETFLTKA